jgi:hypothetical protein
MWTCQCCCWSKVSASATGQQAETTTVTCCPLHGWTESHALRTLFDMVW